MVAGIFFFQMVANDIKNNKYSHIKRVSSRFKTFVYSFKKIYQFFANKLCFVSLLQKSEMQEGKELVLKTKFEITPKIRCELFRYERFLKITSSLINILNSNLFTWTNKNLI